MVFDRIVARPTGGGRLLAKLVSTIRVPKHANGAKGRNISGDPNLGSVDHFIPLPPVSEN